MEVALPSPPKRQSVQRGKALPERIEGDATLFRQLFASFVGVECFGERKIGALQPLHAFLQRMEGLFERSWGDISRGYDGDHLLL